MLLRRWHFRDRPPEPDGIEYTDVANAPRTNASCSRSAVGVRRAMVNRGRLQRGLGRRIKPMQGEERTSRLR